MRYLCTYKTSTIMQIDINGCFAGDIHAICIKKGKHYLTANPQIGWARALKNVPALRRGQGP